MSNTVIHTFTGSSNVLSARFDEGSKTLDVGFKGGKVYRYQNVEREKFEAFKAAKSAGQWFAQNIKDNTAHPFALVRETAPADAPTSSATPLDIDHETQPDAVRERARALYQTYCANSGWKNYEGKPCPSWSDLGNPVRSHWCAVALAVLDASLSGASNFQIAIDGAYAERNKCIAAIAHLARARGWSVGLGEHQDEPGKAWDSEWRTVVFIDLPSGQVSWHIHDSQRPLFAGLSVYAPARERGDDAPQWDGHSTEEKYARLERLRDLL
jgi:hypothetical protein